MTPYDVAMLKNATDCAKYLKSKGGLQANDLAEKSEKFKNDVKQLKQPKKEKEKHKQKAENNDNNTPTTLPSSQPRSKSNDTLAIPKNKKANKQQDMEIVDDEKSQVEKNLKAKGRIQDDNTKNKENTQEPRLKIMKASTSEESISSKHNEDADNQSSKKDLIKKLKKMRSFNNQTVPTPSINGQKRDELRTLRRTNTNNSNSNAANVEPIYKNFKQKQEKTKQMSNSKINKPNENQHDQSEELSQIITKQTLLSKERLKNRSESNKHQLGKDTRRKSSKHRENSNERDNSEAENDDEQQAYFKKKERMQKNGNDSNLSDGEDLKKKRKNKVERTKKGENQNAYSDIGDFENEDDDEERNDVDARKSSGEIELKRNKLTKTRKEKEKKKKEKSSLNSKTNDEMTGDECPKGDESQKGNENVVRLIFKSETNDSPNMWKKKYGNMFERQRLILKSLYEIRRLRINNRDVTIYYVILNFLSIFF
jgi:hypothetical protein